jgi:hypothetical protein
VASFQSVMPNYSEESGGLFRGVGLPTPRSGAAYSEEKGVRREIRSRYRFSAVLFRGVGRTLGPIFRAVLRTTSYRSRHAR